MASRGEMRERQMHLAAVRKQKLLGGWPAQQGKNHFAMKLNCGYYPFVPEFPE